ncbi:hypothetical protein B0H19DRAFT_653526 [Mycena capillaripes]|nr:hypothetical protein B0H19DRAFT_653526 [Mycena capillaripes]
MSAVTRRVAGCTRCCCSFLARGSIGRPLIPLSFFLFLLDLAFAGASRRSSHERHHAGYFRDLRCAGPHLPASRVTRRRSRLIERSVCASSVFLATPFFPSHHLSLSVFALRLMLFLSKNSRCRFFHPDFLFPRTLLPVFLLINSTSAPKTLRFLYSASSCALCFHLALNLCWPCRR